MRLRQSLLSVLTIAFGALSGPFALAETIAVIGTGDVAKALGPAFAAQGHRIVYGSRTPSAEKVLRLVKTTGHGASAEKPAAAVTDAGIVVLAVPGLLVEEITKDLGELSGKIIIDPTNPLTEEPDSLGHGVTTSNAEIIQDAAADAFVVKAFNTLNWRTMAHPDSANGPVSIPLVGNNAEAKEVVAKLVDGMGLEPIDLGPLKYARWVEGMLIVWINNRMSDRDSFEFHLRKTD